MEESDENSNPNSSLKRRPKTYEGKSLSPKFAVKGTSPNPCFIAGETSSKTAKWRFSKNSEKAVSPMTKRSKSVCLVGLLNENALVERFIRTVKEEHIDYTEYSNLGDVFDQSSYWLEEKYRTERIHSSLGCLNPAEFEAALVDIQPDPPLMNA